MREKPSSLQAKWFDLTIDFSPRSPEKELLLSICWAEPLSFFKERWTDADWADGQRDRRTNWQTDRQQMEEQRAGISTVTDFHSYENRLSGK